VYLGDHRNALTQKFKKLLMEVINLVDLYQGIPQCVIEEHIQDGRYTTIGGDLQLGVSDQYGFRPFSICKPRILESQKRISVIWDMSCMRHKKRW
jgi:hypothetical protein